MPRERLTNQQLIDRLRASLRDAARCGGDRRAPWIKAITPTVREIEARLCPRAAPAGPPDDDVGEGRNAREQWEADH